MEGVPLKHKAEKSKLLGKRLSVHTRNPYRPAWNIIGLMFFALLGLISLTPITHPILVTLVMYYIGGFILFIAMFFNGIIFNGTKWNFFTSKLIIFENGLVFIAPIEDKIILWEHVGSAKIETFNYRREIRTIYHFTFYDHSNKRLVSFSDYDFNKVRHGPLIDIMTQCYLENLFALDFNIVLDKHKRK